MHRAAGAYRRRFAGADTQDAAACRRCSHFFSRRERRCDKPALLPFFARASPPLGYLPRRPPSMPGTYFATGAISPGRLMRPRCSQHSMMSPDTPLIYLARHFEAISTRGYGFSGRATPRLAEADARRYRSQPDARVIRRRRWLAYASPLMI